MSKVTEAWIRPSVTTMRLIPISTIVARSFWRSIAIETRCAGTTSFCTTSGSEVSRSNGSPRLCRKPPIWSGAASSRCFTTPAPKSASKSSGWPLTSWSIACSLDTLSCIYWSTDLATFATIVA